MLGREYIIRAISELDGERMMIDEGRPVQTIDFVTTELILVEIAVRDERRVDRFLLHEQTEELMRRFDDLEGTYAIVRTHPREAYCDRPSRIRSWPEVGSHTACESQQPTSGRPTHPTQHSPSNLTIPPRNSFYEMLP